MTTTPYMYRLGSDGCDDTWDVISTRSGEVVAAVPFWDDVDGAEATAKELSSAADARDLLWRVSLCLGDVQLYRAFEEVIGMALAITVKVVDFT